ncbi:MAG: M48 family metalloprotease [Candidatus Mariimomonas ferrooxydans]
MVDACLIQAVGDPFKLTLAGISILIAFSILITLKRFDFSNKGKIALIYIHLSAIFFPIGLFSTSAVCGFLCLPCYGDPVGLAIAALPTTFLMSTLAGFVIIPTYYILNNRKRQIREGFLIETVTKHSKRIGIKPPSVFLIDRAKPVAFSFKFLKSALFVSVGLLDILNKKEKEAVLIHELAHVKFKSSIFKLSTFLMKFSPFSIIKSFNQDLTEEERRADNLVCDIQGTKKHLLSAKRKIQEWESCMEGNE